MGSGSELTKTPHPNPNSPKELHGTVRLRRAERIADDIDRVLPFLMDGVDAERTARLAQFAHDLRNLGRDQDD